MSDRAYRGLHYDDPLVQAEFERLVQRIGDAERARAPIAERHRKAERDMDSGAISGARFRSIDDEYIAGYPEDLPWAVELLNRCLEGVHVKKALHICFGNRYGKPSWAGDYRFLVPAIYEAHIDQLLLEFARRGQADLAIFRDTPAPFEIGLGVIDVKDWAVETPEAVAKRIIQATSSLPSDKLWINPDCGLRHLSVDVARAKLKTMVEGARLARELV